MKKIYASLLLVVVYLISQPINAQFSLHSNGVTCLCPTAAVGEEGVVNGITYKKRTRDQITPQNAATTCTSGITDMSALFYGTSFNSNINSWDVSSVTNMRAMFYGVNFNQPIGNWDVSNVNDMHDMFFDSSFNQPIGNWNVSNVINMSMMFYSTPFNQPIGAWNVGNVTNMSRMFDTSTFNQDLSNWNVSNVTDMYAMFAASSFNKPIDNWNVSSVSNMSLMFFNSPFNQSIGSWNVGNVNDMSRMFESSNFNKFIGNWNVINVSNMNQMFFDTPFNQSIGSWNVSNVNNMSMMFYSTPFNQPIGAWNVGNVNNMSRMFESSTFNQDISNWNVSSVSNMSLMFLNCPFNKPISSWNVGNVNDMSRMFESSNFNQPIENWNVSNVLNMNNMFTFSSFNQPLNNWNVSNVTNMLGMFRGSPFNKPINNWNVLNVTNMSGMFENTSFNQPIASWNISSVTDMSAMFRANLSFNQPLNSWNVGNIENMNEMFFNAQAFNQPLDSWDVSNVINMGGMFRQSNINQNFSNWQFNPDVILTTSSNGFIDYTPMSIANYDALLSQFDNLQLTDKQLSSINVTYCNTASRNNLINNRGWIITGDILNATTLSAPSNITVVANNGFCEATNVNLGTPTAQGCSGYTLSNNAPSVFNLGTTLVTWTLDNNNGTTLTSTQNVTVTTSNGATSLPTSITAPSNLTLVANQGSCEATNVNLGSPIAESCLTYTVSNNAPLLFPVGDTVVTWTLTDANGTSVSNNQLVTVTVNSDNASVCYITSDSTEPTKNRIFINNIDGNNVTNYEILRETSANVFTSIGTLLPTETSFLDNSSNNLSQSYSYKVKTNTICNTSNTNQTFHKTILLQSNVAVGNSVNLSWTPYLGITYGDYKIYRKINTGVFEQLTTIPSSSLSYLSYNDLNTNITQNNYEYYVSISLSNCIATGKNNSANLTEIKSNRGIIGNTMSVNDFDLSSQVNIYPNPTNKELSIKLNDGNDIISCEIFNNLGQKVMEFKELQTSVEQLPTSTYFVKIITSQGQAIKKFIKN
ncbi:BspA family leucine-rich repeat surface protein [Flavobacterium sp.]|uniref:BspA family leucine-rich repeat surface protein n=1 Tax=Flavobacterium sp. TaxID=239 RepID=UPI003340F919